MHLCDLIILSEMAVGVVGVSNRKIFNQVRVSQDGRHPFLPLHLPQVACVVTEDTCPPTKKSREEQ